MDGSGNIDRNAGPAELSATPGPGHNLPYDVEAVRADFPILARTVHGRRLAYLDSAGSAQKPRAVIDAERLAYETAYSNVHRGASHLAALATAGYEGARSRVARFVNAADAREIVFTRGATEAINLVAASWGRRFLKPGDEIVLSELEHHSNIVPWQLAAEATGAVIRVAPIAEDGSFDLDGLARLLGPRTRIVALAHMSNVLGTVLPARKAADMVHAVGALLLLDGCQAAVHLPVDVQAIGCDFYAFSGHKLYGPSGIGVLWGKAELLDGMPPWQGGGGMIETVSFARTTYGPIPARFEAGTPAIAQAPALTAALDYVEALGPMRIAAHEARLLATGEALLREIPGLTLHSRAPGRGAILTFSLTGASGALIHPHDIATVLDRYGVAIRAGHHCAQPLMEKLGVPATTRISLGLYSSEADLDQAMAGLRRARELLG